MMIGRPAWLSRSLLVRTALLLLAVAAWAAGDALLSHFEKETRKPVLFRFQLPFPEDICDKYGLPADGSGIEIQSVTLAGFFSDWNAENPGYHMSLQPDGAYEIRIDLDPGVHQYKFVVRLKNDLTQYWVQDAKNTHTINDGFGGLNSVISIPDYGHLRFVFGLLTLGFAILLAAYLIMESLIRFLLFRRMSFRWKLVLSVLALSVLSNAVFIGYNMSRLREFARSTVVSQLNLVHLFLLAEGVNFDKLDRDPDVAGKAISRFLVNAGAMGETRRAENNQVVLRTIAVYSTDYRMLSASYSRHEKIALQSQVRDDRYASPEEYLRDVIYRPLIQEAQKQPQPVKRPFTGQMRPESLKHVSSFVRDAYGYLGFNTVLVPIRHEARIVGYYAADFYIQAFSGFIRPVFWFNLLLLPLSGIFVFLLLSGLGKQVIGHLLRLVGWSDRIIRGDFGQTGRIDTQDEIGRLAENFDRMRKSLLENFERIHEQNEKLLEADRLKDEFLANTSHELRTPLTGIIGLSESIRDGVYGDVADGVGNAVALILQNGRSLDTLVGNILEYSRLKRREVALRVSGFDVRDAIRSAADIVRPIAERKGLVLLTHLPEGLADVWGDRDRVRQILLNLLGNAVKFTRAGKVEVLLSSEENRVRISIVDTGIGIRTEDQAAIFQEFRQLDGSSTRQYEGTGLGLAIASKLVELHGSRIEVRSAPGEGSDFSFTLPCGPELFIPAEATVTDGAEQPSAPRVVRESLDDSRRVPGVPFRCTGAGERVVVIDDEPVNLEILKSRLEAAGYLVEVISDPEAALRQCLDCPPHLVFLDIMMPKVSGWDFLSRFRSEKILADIPVIMLTARDTPADRVFAFTAGADDFVSKPFSTEELLARTRHHIDRMLAERSLCEIRDRMESEKILAEKGAEELALVLARRDDDHLDMADDTNALVYGSAAMKEVIARLKQAASISRPVLITGETGTGKELIARLLHRETALSGDKPFVPVNCAAIPHTLWEEELFGHVKGSFTDARKDRSGMVAQADQGTLFFDEVGEIPVDIQAKLLRLLQENQYQPIGGERLLESRCRFVFATNRDIPAMVKEGRFREDLYYRISVFEIGLPPLRERREDIPALVRYFLARFGPEFGIVVKAVEEQAMRRLAARNWPGNIRELQNCLIRGMAVLAGGKNRDGRDILTLADLPLGADESTPGVSAKVLLPLPDAPFEDQIAAFTRSLLESAMEKAGGNKTRAAEFLGIKRTTLNYKLKEHGFE